MSADFQSISRRDASDLLSHSFCGSSLHIVALSILIKTWHRWLPGSILIFDQRTTVCTTVYTGGLIRVPQLCTTTLVWSHQHKRRLELRQRLLHQFGRLTRIYMQNFSGTLHFGSFGSLTTVTFSSVHDPRAPLQRWTGTTARLSHVVRATSRWKSICGISSSFSTTCYTCFWWQWVDISNLNLWISPSSLTSDCGLTCATTENHKFSYENEKAHHGSTTSTTFSTGSTMSSTTTNDPSTTRAQPHQEHNYNFISHSSEEGSDTNLLFLKVSTSSTQTTVCSTFTTAAANSSSSTLSLNTANASADSTLCSGRTNLLRSTSPCSSTNLCTPGIGRSASNKSVEGMFISPDFAAETNLTGGHLDEPDFMELGQAGSNLTLPIRFSKHSKWFIGFCLWHIMLPDHLYSTSHHGVPEQKALPARWFQLDLTYITDRIIAMGYPADTTEALYRNSMTHIVKFLGGSFLKGALKVRVANGDVDVFLGEDLWLSAEKSEEEEEMHSKYPIMTGEDQFDPNHPQPGKDCISRRCYGWTVPANKRVFLEGDVRIDLFQKSQLQLAKIRLKKQEKEKDRAHLDEHNMKLTHTVPWMENLIH
uniref:Uncharacterized protein n=1 Tax=Ditylenchus dipsaci TaxID=166011 RepID=A0A915DPS9_9BILA